jgi:hypothetical protein
VTGVAFKSCLSGGACASHAGFGVAPKQSSRRKLEYCVEFRASRKVRDRGTRSPARETHALSRKCAQIVGHIWIFRGEHFDIADFNVDFLYSGPFCARAEEPAPLSDDACSVERIARDQKLYALTSAEIWTDYGAFACAVFVQHKNFNRITQITAIKLAFRMRWSRTGASGVTMK